MEHPVVRPLFQLHDNLEDDNLNQAAHGLEQMIFGIQDLIAQLRVERQQVAIRILFTILVNPDVWTPHFVAQ